MRSFVATLLLFGALGLTSGAEKPFQPVHVEDGVLRFADGSEVALWGVNFQSPMSWEYRRMARHGAVRDFDSDSYKAIVDENLDEIQKLGCEIIRVHLAPSDYAGPEGGLVENQWLDMLDYTMAECVRRGIYVSLSFLNSLGGGEKTSFADTGDQAKWQWLAVPALREKCERYIRELVNRPNPYDNNRLYKNNPAFILVEYMNEPMFPKEKPEGEDATGAEEGLAFYAGWLEQRGLEDSPETWKIFHREVFQEAVAHFLQLMREEKVPAAPVWSLLWSKGPIHQTNIPFEVVAESEIPVVSFSTYPGQDHSKKVKDGELPHLEEINFLPYLLESYKQPDWQGWLQKPEFKGRKASVVYEWETWHNRSGYLYPAVAKYFRAQGAQAATMWTYTFSVLGPFLKRNASHNLSLTYTPKKAAAFLVAGEVFKNIPRYQDLTFSAADADRSDSFAVSFPEDRSAFRDRETLIHAGNVDPGFIEMPTDPKRIVGYGSSPFLQHDGTGLYFLTREDEGWKLELLPHFEWIDDDHSPERANPKIPKSRLDSERASQVRLYLPDLDRKVKVYRAGDAGKTRVPSTNIEGGIQFDASPGTYHIR